MTNGEKDPWREGGQAFRDGLPIGANPYRRNTWEWRDWCQGWSDHDNPKVIKDGGENNVKIIK